MKGADYLNHFVLPNFYFHVAIAYTILRHNGVELGKQDFLAGIPLKRPLFFRPGTPQTADGGGKARRPACFMLGSRALSTTATIMSCLTCGSG